MTGQMRSENETGTGTGAETGELGWLAEYLTHPAKAGVVNGEGKVEILVDRAKAPEYLVCL
jgi:hypothetical protein